MDLTTRVTLYPLHLLPPHKELDSKNDNELYGDGLPSVSDFYSGKRADFQGRQLKDLHAFKGNYQRLYEVGDYIQTQFAYLMQTIFLLNKNKFSEKAFALIEYLQKSPNLDEESKKQLEEELIEFSDS